MRKKKHIFLSFKQWKRREKICFFLRLMGRKGDVRKDTLIYFKVKESEKGQELIRLITPKWKSPNKTSEKHGFKTADKWMKLREKIRSSNLTKGKSRRCSKTTNIPVSTDRSFITSPDVKQ